MTAQHQELLTNVYTPEGLTPWFIAPGLSDCGGELVEQAGDAAYDLQVQLHSNEREILVALREKQYQVGCRSYIGWKDGSYGLLFEVEFFSTESDPERGRGSFDEVTAAVVAEIPRLESAVPGVSICACPENTLAFGRPGVWAFVKAELLDQTDYKTLLLGLYGIKPGQSPDLCWYTVIAQNDQTGQICSYWVMAGSMAEAFYRAAIAVGEAWQTELQFICALPGKVCDGSGGIAFPGAAGVFGCDIVDDPEVWR